MYGYYYMYGTDFYVAVLMIAAMIFALAAQISVKSTFNRYSKKLSSRGITGAQAARMILDRNDLTGVRIERISGSLTDHYDPRSNVIRLSDSVHDNSSVAAVGVAAHECGHAVQYAAGYGPVKLRAAIIPITQFSSRAAVPLIIIGLLINLTGLAYLGVLFFALATFFQLVTLPVEFNASHRALATLEEYGTLSEDELSGARKVLRAAAMTYVAALAVSLVQLLRWIAVIGSNSNNRRGRR